MFADDIKLYSKAEVNHSRIQSDILKVCDWFKKLQLPLNSQRCKKSDLASAKTVERLISCLLMTIKRQIYRESRR